MESHKTDMMPTRPAGIWLGNDLLDGNDTPILVDCFDRGTFRQTAVRLVMDYDDKPAVAALRAVLRQHLELGRDVTVIDPIYELNGLDPLLDDGQTGAVVMPSRLDDGCIDPFVLRAPRSWEPGMPTPQDEARDILRKQMGIITCLLTPTLRAWSFAWGWDTGESERIVADAVDAFYAGCDIRTDGPIDYARWEPGDHGGRAMGGVPCMREFKQFLQRKVRSLYEASDTNMEVADFVRFVRRHATTARLSEDDHLLYVLTALSLCLDELCDSTLAPLPYVPEVSDDVTPEGRRGRVSIIRAAGFYGDPVEGCPYTWVVAAMFARIAIDTPSRMTQRIVVMSQHAWNCLVDDLRMRMVASVIRQSNQVPTSIWYVDPAPEGTFHDTRYVHDMTPMAICFPHMAHHKAMRQLCERAGIPDEIRGQRIGAGNGNAAVILRGLQSDTWLVDTRPMVEAIEGGGEESSGV